MNRKRAVFMWLIATTFVIAMVPSAVLAQYSAQQWIPLSIQNPERVERTFHTGVYSPASNRLIVFGGTVLGASLDDLWILTNANGLGGTPEWRLQVHPLSVAWPEARSRHTAVYDTFNDRMIIFGGCTLFCTPALNDVWVLTNASGAKGTPTWQQLSPLGTPPEEREVATAVYDYTTNHMIIYGGDGGGTGSLADVWTLSHANGLGGTPQWTQLFPVGGPPTGQKWHSAVYDAKNNIMTVFGGKNGITETPTNEVWTLSHANGKGGTPVWTKLNMTYGDCPARMSQKAVYDISTNTMTIVGGVDASGAMANDTWVLWNANGLGGEPGWTQLLPSGSTPVPRGSPAFVLDTINNRAILFGGNGQEGYLFATWVMTHANGM